MQTCAVLNFAEQRIEYYDSLGGVDEHTIDSLLRWVEDEYVDKYKQPPPERFQVRHSSLESMSSDVINVCDNQWMYADQELDTDVESWWNPPAAQWA